ncbi:MAG TPA: YceI family protein [Polyangia bacterium]
MRRLTIAAVVVVAVTAAAAVARAQAPAAELGVVPAESSITYHLVHKLHKIDGTSHKLEGKARITPDGKAQVLVRVPAESFDSANVNRDAHMKEAVEAAKYPWVEIKALGEGVTPPATFPTTQKKTFKAQLTFHGIQNVFDLPIDVTWESPTKVHASTTFPISLDGFKVERPSLMFVKVDDELKLDAKIAFSR